MQTEKLYEKLSKRLIELEKLPKLKEEKSISKHLDEKGITRRDFMKWAAAITAMLALPGTFTPLVAKYKVIINPTDNKPLLLFVIISLIVDFTVSKAFEGKKACSISKSVVWKLLIGK